MARNKWVRYASCQTNCYKSWRSRVGNDYFATEFGQEGAAYFLWIRELNENANWVSVPINTLSTDGNIDYRSSEKKESFDLWDNPVFHFGESWLVASFLCKWKPRQKESRRRYEITLSRWRFYYYFLHAK